MRRGFRRKYVSSQTDQLYMLMCVRSAHQGVETPLVAGVQNKIVFSSTNMCGMRPVGGSSHALRLLTVNPGKKSKIKIAHSSWRGL